MNKSLKSIISLILTAVMILSAGITGVYAATDEISQNVQQPEQSSEQETKPFRLADKDITGDGRFTTLDVRTLLRIVAKVTPEPENFDRMSYDMDKNGKFTVNDVKYLLICLAGFDPATYVPPKHSDPTTVPPTTVPPTTLPPTTKPPVTTTRNPMQPIDSRSPVSFNCNEVVVFDITNNQMLYSYNSTSKAYPASMTKIMTALVAVRYVPLDYVITVGSELYLVDSNSSLAYLQWGYRMTMQDLITSLLLPSGCDSAYVIAVNVARYIYGKNLSDRAALSEFIKLMNRTAKDLGCTNTNFMNPSGYPNNNHYTCARDMCLIAKAAYANSTLRLITSWYRKTITIKSGQTLTYDNSNKLLWSGSGYYYKYACGMKTGTHSQSGTCLTAVAKKDGRALLVIIMGGDTNYDRYQTSIDYFEYYFNHR